MITDYNDLTLGRYIDIIDAAKDDKLDELDKNAKILSVLLDCKPEDVINTDILEFQRLMASAQFLSYEPKPAKKLRHMYRVGEWTLVPTKDAFHLTAGQYIDFQSLVNDEHRLLHLCSILLVPQGKTYGNGYDVAEVREAIAQGLCVKDAVTIVAFFFGLSRKSTDYTLRCLAVTLNRMRCRTKNEKEKEMLKQATLEMRHLLDSLTDGDGSRR